MRPRTSMPAGIEEPRTRKPIRPFRRRSRGRSSPGLFSACLVLILALASPAAAQQIRFPTANRALLETGGEPQFFVGTVGRPWTSGMFGCVRTEGRQIHEGIDIKCLKRDARNEPSDPVMAAAPGTVAYINPKAGLSNFGIYVILKHQISGLEIYTTYAHLSKVRPGLRAGTTVAAGEEIATMGRTANTKQGISKERAHLHFEVNMLLNDQFSEWHNKALAGQRNDHGDWNGQNLAGLNPGEILLAQARQGSSFDILNYVRGQTELCRVLVRDTSFPWLRRYTSLIRRNPRAEREGVAGYEISLNYTGVPFQLIPRSPSEMPGTARYKLLSVNESERKQRPCRNLVAQRAGKWELAAAGTRLLDLLTY